MFGTLASYFRSVSTWLWGVADDWPWVVKVPLNPFTDTLGEWFGLIADAFGMAEGWADGISSRLDALSPWDVIYDYIRQTWSWIDDIGGTIASGVEDIITRSYSEIRDFAGNVVIGVHDVVSTSYSEITDFWGNAKIAADDLIKDQYSLITDFWGNVGVGISDWFETNLFPWLEDRAERAVAVAGKILDKVW